LINQLISYPQIFRKVSSNRCTVNRYFDGVIRSTILLSTPYEQVPKSMVQLDQNIGLPIAIG